MGKKDLHRGEESPLITLAKIREAMHLLQEGQPLNGRTRVAGHYLHYSKRTRMFHVDPFHISEKLGIPPKMVEKFLYQDFQIYPEPLGEPLGEGIPVSMRRVYNR